MSVEQQLIERLNDKIRNDKLLLPTLPDIALKVRRQADEMHASLQDMADIIGQDPALAARLIKVANSAFLGRSIRVTTLPQAATRIGLTQIKNIATAMALEQLYVSKQSFIQQQLDQIWQDSVQMAAMAVACLKYYQSQHGHSGLNTDVLALAALLHNIGALPVLTEAEQQPELFGHPAFLRRVIEKASSVVGRKILQAWNFADELQQVVAEWRELRPQKVVGYTDFVRLAAIGRDYYQDKAAQQQLLEYYVDQQLAPIPQFMQQEDIAAVYQDIRSLFH